MVFEACSAAFTWGNASVFQHYMGDPEHDTYLMTHLEEAQKLVEIARNSAEMKMECDSMTTEAPNVKEQPKGIVNKAKRALLGFIQVS